MKTYSLAIMAALLFSLQPAIAQIQPAPKIFDPRTDTMGSFNGIERGYYPDGKLQYWKMLALGKANGLWLEWYPDGTLRYRANWKDNMGHGKWEYFYPSGVLRSLEVFEKDIPVGLVYAYHPNGTTKSVSTYVAGRLEGEALTYDSYGALIGQTMYKNGQQVLDRPTLFAPGVVATEQHNEWDITFEPDGNTLYFTRRTAGVQAQKIMTARRSGNGWTAPEVAPFSTHTDEGPYITPDGQRFYFASFRPLPFGAKPSATDMNIWYMDKSPQGWSVPKPVGSGINFVQRPGERWPQHYEAGPVTDPAGNLYYWTQSPMGNDGDIFMAPLLSDGTFGTPATLGSPPNHAGFDSSPVVSPDGNYLFFASYGRPDGLGQEDIYYARKVDGQWTPPKNLGATVNGMHNDVCPRFSPDGKYFYFSSDRGDTVDANGERSYSIYTMETAYLLIE